MRNLKLLGYTLSWLSYQVIESERKIEMDIFVGTSDSVLGFVLRAESRVNDHVVKTSQDLDGTAVLRFVIISNE